MNWFKKSQNIHYDWDKVWKEVERKTKRKPTPIEVQKEMLKRKFKENEKAKKKELVQGSIINWYKKAKEIPGGLADKKKDTDFNSKELGMGRKIELEHTMKK